MSRAFRISPGNTVVFQHVQCFYLIHVLDTHTQMYLDLITSYFIEYHDATDFFDCGSEETEIIKLSYLSSFNLH